MVKLNAKQLRKESVKFNPSTTLGTRVQSSKLRKNDIYIILDNVLDTYNIGSIFRLADAVGAKKIYLCGETEIPPNPRIKKASINTTEWVEWEYCETAMEAIAKATSESHLRGEKNTITPRRCRFKGVKLQVIAIEQSAMSIPYHKFEYKMPLALIVGNETYGVSKEVLEKVDAIVELPMFGVNISLNVMISLGIVLYETLLKHN